MNQLDIHNPFGAPVYHEDTVDSTMNLSRDLARQGKPHGTVIIADFQEAGRGRVMGRSWNMEKGSSLACTILLRFSGIESIPPALTLRTGLAVSRAIEDFVPALAGKVLIKWPNDLIVDKKIAGILTEADGGNVHVGIGINVGQKQFPAALQDKATSLSLAANREFSGEARFVLLEKLLIRLQAEVKNAGNGTDWHRHIEERLYKKGEEVCFAEGAADSKKVVKGPLSGIGPGGELLIGDGSLKEPLAFITGELLFSGISEIV